MPFAVEEPLGGRALAGVKGGAREEAEPFRRRLAPWCRRCFFSGELPGVGAPEEAR